MKIYADVIFLLNFIMNSLVLIVTAYISGVGLKLWRILLAAAAGAVYVLGEWVPELYVLYYLPCKLLGLFVLIYMAFGYKSCKSFLVMTGSFLISSFVLGGAVLGWIGFTQNDGLLWSSNPFDIKIAWTHLLGGVCMGLSLLAIVFRQMFAKMLQRRTLYQIKIEYRKRSISVSALLDTGNSLYAGMGKPVVLVEYTMLKKLLPDLTVQFLDSCNHNEWLTNLARCKDIEWIKRIQVIPYKAVGITSMLLGFRPDKLVVVYDDKNIVTDQVIIGIYIGVLSKAGIYTALLHSAILDEINLCPGANNKKEASICVKLGQ